MGRTLKRVPLDFGWPLGMKWKGYISPYQAQKCEACGGTGYSREMLNLQDSVHQWAGNLTEEEVSTLKAEGCLNDLIRNKLLPADPTAEDVNYLSETRGASRVHWMHSRELAEIRARSMGVETLCYHCKGDGSVWFSEKVEQLADRWYDDERYDPPTGEGYQLWETTSEGSPQSPVFSTLEDLCKWCETGATTFADFKATAEDWYTMLKGDRVHHRSGNMVFI